MFKLVIEDDEGNKTIVPVIRDEISIGRQEGNTIRLTERNVSRQHAKLVREDGSVYFEEISSRYGTKCNGEKIEGRTPFKIGDVFLIGDYRLTLKPEKDTSPDPPEIPTPADPSLLSEPEPRASDGTEIMPVQPARLVIVSSNFSGQEFPLDRKEMIIGREEECDIIIDHRSVSATHAKIVREPKGVYKIVDLNSKNGVKVSGEEYKAIHLKRGDVIELGHVRFRFVEPGENYVFTPMAFDDFEDAQSRDGGQQKMLMGGGIIIVMIVLLASVAWMMAKDKADEEIKEVVVAPKEIVKTEPTDLNKKVDAIIADSQDHVKRGEIEKAIAKLDTARDLDPTPEQAIKIDRMLSDASAWAPMSRAFSMGRDYFVQKQYSDALSKFKEVSADDTTPIYALMIEQGYPENTVRALLDRAEASIDAGDNDDALDAIEDVLLFDDEHERAIVLKEQLSEKPKLVAVKKKDDGDSNNIVVKKQREKVDKKDDGKLDVDKGKETFNKAFEQFVSGQYASAIKVCKTGLRKYKYRKCHNVIATSYLKLGKTADACKHFRALKIDRAECE